MIERRNPIICPCCKTPMIPMARRIELIGMLDMVYQWWVCPRRKGEGGCGHVSLIEHTEDVVVKL